MDQSRRQERDIVFHIGGHGSFMFHVRDIYLVEWNEEFSCFQQYAMASNAFASKAGANRWVKRNIMTILSVNGKLYKNQR